MQSALQRTGRSFQEIYRETLPTVYRVAYSYMKNRYDSEDAAQEAFLRLMKQTKPFGSAEHVKAWLIVTVSNVCRDMLRRRERGEENLEEYRNLSSDPPPDNELMTAILALPESYKTVVYLYYYEGYRVKEIARLLKQSPETVKTWLRRARAQLKTDLGEDFDEG